jgi:hypothetical protein
MNKTKVLFAISMLSLASSAVAQATQDTPKKPKGDPNRIICRTEDEIGSRIKKVRICLTAAEWRARAQNIGTDIEKREAAIAKTGG